MQGATWHVNITFVKWNLVGIPLATKKKKKKKKKDCLIANQNTKVPRKLEVMSSMNGQLGFWKIILSARSSWCHGYLIFM
jgi:hypothetical protein